MTHDEETLLTVLMFGRGFGLELMDKAGLPVGAIYPALRSLEGKGWLRSYVTADAAEARGGRPRRYYEITPEGKLALLTREGTR